MNEKQENPVMPEELPTNEQAATQDHEAEESVHAAPDEITQSGKPNRPDTAPACPQCGEELPPEQDSCINCSRDMGMLAAVPASVPVPVLPVRNTRKKKICIVCIAAVCVVALCVVSFTAIRRNSALKRIENAVADYRSETISYDTAILILDGVSNIKDSRVVSKAKAGKKTVSDLFSSREKLKNAQTSFDVGDYAEAYQQLSEIGENDPCYDDAQNLSQNVLAQWKENVIENVDAFVRNNKISEASAIVKEYLEVNEDQDIVDRKVFLFAEEAFLSGDLKYADEKYNALPSALTVGGISVKSRQDTLRKNAFAVSISGVWKANDNYYETKATTRSGRWQNWYNNYYTNTTFLFMRCTIGSDGSIHYDASIWYYTYTNFATNKYRIKSGTENADYSGKFSPPKNGKLSLTLTNTSALKSTLTFDGKEFNYKQHDIQWDSGTKYEWWVDATYGGRSDFAHVNEY